MAKNKFLLLILAVLILLAVLGIKYLYQSTPVITEPEEKVLLWSEKESIPNFYARVLEVKNKEIDTVTTLEIKGEKARVKVVVTGETQILRGSIDKSEGFPKRVYEAGELKDIRQGQEIQVFSDGDIRREKRVNALTINIFLESEEQWLNVFEGQILEAVNNELLVQVMIEKEKEEIEVPLLELRLVRVVITDDTELDVPIENLVVDTWLRITSDSNILDISGEAINALKIELLPGPSRTTRTI